MIEWIKSIATSTWSDWRYMVAFVPALGLSIWAQITSFISFKKYNNRETAKKVKAETAAKNIIEKFGIKGVKIQKIKGEHINHYNPREKTLYLSSTVYGKKTIAAMGVAAHEAGHVVHYNQGKGVFFLRFRNILLIPVNFLSNLAIPVYLIGFFTWHPLLMNIGAWSFSAIVLFHLISLPVELNANIKAMKVIKKRKYLRRRERRRIRAIMISCALYYISASLTSIFHLARLIFLSHREID